MGLVNNMVLQARNPANGGGLPGNTTPQELRFLEQSLPGLAQSAAGRQQLVQILTAQAQRDADRAKYASAAASAATASAHHQPTPMPTTPDAPEMVFTALMRVSYWPVMGTWNFI